jgi:hypothetical protein
MLRVSVNVQCQAFFLTLIANQSLVTANLFEPVYLRTPWRKAP